MELTDGRKEKFEYVASKRQSDLAVILENIHDPHNIGAILRSCDAVGIYKIYIINTDPRLQDESKYKALSSSSGAMKWMHMEIFFDMQKAITDIKSKFDKIYATHLSAEAVSIYETDLQKSCAIAFGNEHEGISEELLSHSDGNIIIPQMGMVQSLNVSVACAVTLFELMRQRIDGGFYRHDYNHDAHHALFQDMFKRHFDNKFH